LCLLLSGCSSWTVHDTRREIAYDILLVADAYQTQRIRDYENIEEAGYIPQRLLGKNPKKGETILYFLGLGFTHFGVSSALPPEVRKWWQYLSIGVQGEAVYSNFELGIR
jgi:hypothetical protein